MLTFVERLFDVLMHLCSKTVAYFSERCHRQKGWMRHEWPGDISLVTAATHCDRSALCPAWPVLIMKIRLCVCGVFLRMSVYVGH